jgi:hypothetical protein
LLFKDILTYLIPLDPSKNYSNDRNILILAMSHQIGIVGMTYHNTKLKFIKQFGDLNQSARAFNTPVCHSALLFCHTKKEYHPKSISFFSEKIRADHFGLRIVGLY